MNPKEFYRTYIADDSWSDLSNVLLAEVRKYNPVHVLEFGSGSGKHLSDLDASQIVACGLDISVANLHVSHYKNGNKFLILGDESHLRHLCNFDIVCTCSVLDHIEDVEDIVEEFKRICNRCVLLAETNDVIGDFYWAHNYEAMGFRKLPFEWQSNDDGATYFIWKWEKP